MCCTFFFWYRLFYQRERESGRELWFEYMYVPMKQTSIHTHTHTHTHTNTYKYTYKCTYTVSLTVFRINIHVRFIESPWAPLECGDEFTSPKEKGGPGIFQAYMAVRAGHPVLMTTLEAMLKDYESSGGVINSKWGLYFLVVIQCLANYLWSCLTLC